MAIQGKAVRQMLKEAKSGRTFKAKFREMLGIRHDPKKEKTYFDASKQEIGPDEFSIRELTEEFCGREFVSESDKPLSSSRMEALTAARTPKETALFEDTVGVDPTAMQDINAWTATVAGLVEVKLLQGYNDTEFIGDQFVEVVPRRQNGGKLIGVPHANPKSVRLTAPNVSFPAMTLQQLYVQIRQNMKVGAQLGLTREAVRFDLGGELMGEAEGAGKTLGWIKEYVIACGVMGLNNPVSANVDASITQLCADSFLMNVGPDATPNPTYQTAGITTNPNLPNAYNYVNKKQQLFADWTSLSSAQSLLNLMRDPVNGLPFQTEIKKVLVDPFQWQQALYVKHQTEVFTLTGTPATAPFQGAASTFPPINVGSPGNVPGSEINAWTPYHSNIWHQAQLDAGASEANAQKRWWAGDPQRAFVWQQCWDFMINQANPSDAEMLQKDILALWVFSWMGQFGVRDPRFNVALTE